MSTKLAHSIVPTMETCPNCKGEMTVTEVAPILFTENLEDVTYRCKGCGSELKRTFKRRSGTWQLIHYHPKLPSLRHPSAISRQGTDVVS
jgi:transposase-like protein